MPYGSVLRLNNLLEIGRMVSDYDLIISSLATNVTGDKKWALGSITNPNEAIRHETISILPVF
jgi:hypothetical protein